MRKYKIFIAVITLALSGCLDVPDKLIMPEWDVDMNIPFANRTYTIQDIIGSQEDLSIDPTDSIYLVNTKDYTQLRNLLDFIKLDKSVQENNIEIQAENASRDIFIDFRSDVITIQRAVFTSGFIDLNIRNRSSLNVTFIVVIPGISSNGVSLRLEIPMVPGEVKSVHQDLTGYIYSEPASQPPLFKNSLWIKAESRATGTNSGSPVQFDVLISDFTFSSVTGQFTQQNLGRKSDTINADLGKDITDFRDKAALRSASLTLSATYESQEPNPFVMKIDSLTILARAGNRYEYFLDSTGSKYMSMVVNHGTVSIIFNENNSNIMDIINMIPEVFEISASFTLIGNNQSGTITNNDVSNISFSLSTKSILALAKSSYSDTLDIHLNQQERRNVRNARTSSTVVEITNRLPLKGWLKVEFLDSLYTHLFTLKAANEDSLQIDAAPVDPATGFAVNTSYVYRNIELTQEDINYLSRAYHVIIGVSFETAGYQFPDAPFVAIRASDWVKLFSYGNLKFHIDDKLGSF